jgi:putative tricarboxylic transport membrane protein
MLIAFILGRPFEEALRQALVGSEGNLSVFFVNPIAAGFLVLTALSVWITLRRSIKGKPNNTLDKGASEQ